MKTLSKTAFVLYLIVLLWLVLFKFSFDFAGVLDMQLRSINLIPFAGYSQANAREMFYNFAVFIPFGLLLCVNLKRDVFWQKLMYVFFFSLGVETVQFMLGIGVSDITDIITNTSGGLAGIALYALGKKYVNHESLDKFIVVGGLILLIAFLFLRVLFLHVRYR